MKITFSSEIKQNGENHRIEFSSPVKQTIDGETKIFEFVEPSQNVANRIEVGNIFVNIFSGPSTINLRLEENIENELVTPQGSIFFQSFMHKLSQSDNKYSFLYTLKQDNILIGEYNITLSLN